MAGMLEADRSRSRRERTYVGSECAVCEEPLEHMLRGERILQFSCSHVSHEACFYEYIKEFESHYCPTCNAPLGLDTSRGGGGLDIEKLSNLVRSVSVSDRSIASVTPTPWDTQTARSKGRETPSRRPTRESHGSRGSRERADRYGTAPARGHHRSDSDNTRAPSTQYTESQSAAGRRHEFDAQSMETSLMSPRSSVSRNPVPPPMVSVRSEFPTLNRLRQQQTLTCLVTVEVPDNNWQPDVDDVRSAPPLPSTRQEDFPRPPSPPPSAPRFYPYESPDVLDDITENLRVRVDNWHGLDFARFGKLRLHGTIKVGKDKQSWQELECYLFGEMLICVKEKKNAVPLKWEETVPGGKTSRCTLKGSILIKKHLIEVMENERLGQTERITAANLRPLEENILTLSLSVAELPLFHLKFNSRNQLKLWQQALMDLNAVESSPIRSHESERDVSDPDDDDWQRSTKRGSSLNSYGAARSVTTAPTEYTSATKNYKLPAAVHVPIDLVVVVPVSSSMHSIKIGLVKDALRFLVQNLGERDRMGLVTFGGSGGGAALVGMTTKTWNGWNNLLANLRPMGQKTHRGDVVEGANVAMDLLMQRKTSNPVSSIFLISDSASSDPDGVDFVVSRAEAAKVAIHSFGLGTTHKPDTMIELSTRTKASYTYVKDWMMLRECLAGCVGSLQSISHQNVKLKLRIPEGSPAKFVKISGALQITKRATGKDAEASLGDLRFGDKKDILVQLVVAPDTTQEQVPQDAWETIYSGLEALGGPLDQEDQRTLSVEEVPLLQADLTWGDILREGSLTHLPRPSLLAITMLPSVPSARKSVMPTPPIPPHPFIVQRRMELLTSDMLTRALTLVSRGQHDMAQHLLTETRSILKGLGKGGLPPIPPVNKSPNLTGTNSPTSNPSPDRHRTPSPGSLHAVHGLSHPPIRPQQSTDALSAHTPSPMPPAATNGIDATTVTALDAELELSLEWINHPTVFGRDSRKAVLQAIGVIASQRGYTFRTPSESLWAGRVGGVKRLAERSREWREESGEPNIMEEV